MTQIPSLQVVNLLRRDVVHFNRRNLVTLYRREVVNFTGVCTGYPKLTQSL